MANRLRRFKKNEVILTVYEANEVLKYFFNLAPPKITDDDRAFAQALMVEAINASSQMGMIENLFVSIFGNVHKGPQKIFVAFVKRAAKDWFKATMKKDMLDDPKIYAVMKNTIKGNFSTVWQMRMAGLGLNY